MDIPAHVRPKTYGDCCKLPRPCPYVSCRYHLFLDVRLSGSIIYNATREVESLVKMPHTCALDVAQEGGLNRHQVGRLLGVNRERIRQIEVVALAKLLKRIGQAAFRRLHSPPTSLENVSL